MIILSMNLPCEEEMVITLEKKDQQFLFIQQLIEEKRNLLLQKQRHLQKASKQNKFLEMVKNDYAKYYDYIAQQKREQIEAFEILNKYLQDLNTTNKLSKYNIEDAKTEQEKILSEIVSIKKSLNQLMSNTNKLDSLIK
jgi:hypothetical protein